MIPFSPPHISEEAIAAVSEVLRSGWITTGPVTKQFEKQLAEYCGIETVLCVSSATAGMELALRWFGVGEGDEVILPAYTYCATANVVRHCGATPILVEVNPSDFNVSVEAIANALTSKTKVIMPVDIGGFPCDYEAIMQLAKDHTEFTASSEVQQALGRVLVLADAAHSFGANFRQEKTGKLADISVFSFHAVKNLTTAEGGAIAFNLPKLIVESKVYKYLNIISLHGQSKDALAKLGSPSWKYDVIESGFKCNMTDIQAAIGQIQLKDYPEIMARRRQICNQYRKAFEQYDWAETPVLSDENRETSYHLFMLRIRGINEEQRDNIIEDIFNQDVSVNVHFQPLPLLTAFSNYNISDFPVAYNCFSREISLPVYYGLSDEQVVKVIDSVVVSVKQVIG